MRIRLSFVLSTEQRRALGQKMGLDRLPTYEECKRFLEYQGLRGLLHAEADYESPQKEQMA